MYYTIENRTDKEVGNVFPQVSCINQDLAHSIQFDEFSNFDNEIIFQLERKAKLTDILSQAAISAQGLLVNEKVKVLLTDFNLIQHRYYKCIVKDSKRRITYNYYWLHLVEDFRSKIDYQKSTFWWTKSTFKKDYISLKSYDDYLEQKEKNGVLWGVRSEKIKLTSQFDQTLDIISSLPFDKGLYISNRLKLALESYAISGIEITEALNII